LHPQSGRPAAVVIVDGPRPAIVVPVADLAVGRIVKVSALRTDLTVFVPLDVWAFALPFDRRDFHLLRPALVIGGLLAAQLAAVIVVLGGKHVLRNRVLGFGLLLIA